MELMEKTVESRVLFEGKIITVRLDKAELPNGRVASREVVEHPGGVAILPLFDDGTVSLVRQFRYPFQEVVAELPAGKLERGEDHRLAALRELEEEVGASCGRLTYLGCLYSSPGFSSEVLHMYLAQELTEPVIRTRTSSSPWSASPSPPWWSRYGRGRSRTPKPWRWC